MNKLKNKTTSQFLDNINEGGINSYRTQSTTDEDLKSNWGYMNSGNASVNNSFSNAGVSFSAQSAKVAMPKMNGHFVFPQTMLPAAHFTPKNVQMMNLNHNFTAMNSNNLYASLANQSGNQKNPPTFNPIPVRDLNPDFAALKGNNQLQMSSLYKAPPLKQSKMKMTRSDKTLVIDKIRTMMEVKSKEEEYTMEDKMIPPLNDVKEERLVDYPDVLEVKIKTGEGELKVFKFSTGDDLIKTATSFCEEHKISSQLINPICVAVTNAFESVRSVLISKVEDVENLDRAFKEYNELVQKSFCEDEETNVLSDLSTLSCLTVFDYEVDEEDTRLNKSL